MSALINLMVSGAFLSLALDMSFTLSGCCVQCSGLDLEGLAECD